MARVPVLQEGVCVVLTSDGELWLTNFGEVSAEIGPGEVFGFNVGSWQDKPQGQLLTCKQQMQINIFW